MPDFQLSLAIGKEGQNARLATRLTGLRVDIRSETEIAEQEAYERTYGTDAWADGEWVVDPESRRAALAAGRRFAADDPRAVGGRPGQRRCRDEVETQVEEALDGDVAEAVDEADRPIAAAEVDGEESAGRRDRSVRHEPGRRGRRGRWRLPMPRRRPVRPTDECSCRVD